MTDKREAPLHLGQLFVAAVLSAILPGLGQGFGGRPWRGLAFVVAFAAATIPALLSFLYMPTVIGLVLPVVVVLGGRLWAMIDAAFVAMRPDHVRWGRRLASTALLLVAAIVADGVVAMARHRYLGASFRLPAGSMEPTLLEGEYFFTVPLSSAKVRRGEVIVFRWPDDSTRSFVKRVVGVPGDTLSMHDGVLFLNAKAVREPYVHHVQPGAESTDEEFNWQRAHLVRNSLALRTYRPSKNNWGPILVPARMYFVLGDNRDNSLDSRYRGFVSFEDVFARPYRVYFSRDLSTGSIRWNRIGIELSAPSA